MNQNEIDMRLHFVQVSALVVKSKWQTKYGKWWTNDGSGKKQYNPNAGGNKPQSGGDSPKPVEGVKRTTEGWTGSPNSGMTTADWSGVKDKAPGAKIPPIGKVAANIDKLKTMQPAVLQKMYTEHLKDPAFAKSEVERVSELMGEPVDMDTVMSTMEHTEPGELKRDIIQAYKKHAG